MHDILAIVETGIYVGDLDRAEQFYRDALGLPLISRDADRHVFFRVGTANVLLLFNPTATIVGGNLPPHGATGAGHFAMGIRPEALPHWRQHLGACGVTIEQEVQWPRGGHSLYFRDPAGNLVELITPGIWGTPAGW